MLDQTRLEITYQDGAKRTVMADQRDAEAFERWGAARGFYAPRGTSLMAAMPSSFYRVAAWSALQREAGKAIDYDTWTATVFEALPVSEPQPVDPTTGGGD